MVSGDTPHLHAPAVARARLPPVPAVACFLPLLLPRAVPAAPAAIYASSFLASGGWRPSLTAAGYSCLLPFPFFCSNAVHSNAGAAGAGAAGGQVLPRAQVGWRGAGRLGACADVWLGGPGEVSHLYDRIAASARRNRNGQCRLH